MNASELFKAGKLQEAIAAQMQEVKANATDQAKRLFLFELLAFAGELDRAQRQIEAIHHDDPEIDTAVAAYAKLLEAEQQRRRLFRDGVSPQFLAEVPEHVRLRLDAVNRLRENHPAEAAELLSHADRVAPAIQGELNGKPFDALRDCDDLFASVLEVMSHGDYYWVPLEQVDTLTMNPPKFPRDLLWIPARLEIRDGPAGDVFLPALYPGSHEHSDNQVKLGRLTDWKSPEEGPVLGVGLHTFLVGEDTITLLEWRTLNLGGFRPKS
jgi:type VI secretion system protein ImpE